MQLLLKVSFKIDNGKFYYDTLPDIISTYIKRFLYTTYTSITHIILHI